MKTLDALTGPHPTTDYDDRLDQLAKAAKALEKLNRCLTRDDVAALLACPETHEIADELCTLDGEARELIERLDQEYQDIETRGTVA